MLDASVALWACRANGRWERFVGVDLVAPPLMWSEFRSSLHAAVWRRQVSAEQASRSLAALEASPVAPHAHPDLGQEAWRIADDFGWAKTYDAEYVALPC